MTSPLRADVWVSSRLPIAIKRRGEDSSFSPISCTLIQTPTSCVLVDTPISVHQTTELIAWIEEIAPGKPLSYIYITHGHGDHFFGLPILLSRFTEARAIASPGTVAHARKQLEPETFENIWRRFFPGGQIHQPQVLPEAWPDRSFSVDGHDFQIIGVGHTDTADTTVLYVPAIHLVVAGDVVYGDVHQFFGEADTPAKRGEWLRALDTIENLRPEVVIAGHKRAGTVDGVFNVRATREYILAFEGATKTAAGPEEVFKRMVEMFPSRINPHAIYAGALAAFGSNVYSFKD
ncbi:beta-lactamase-like protein [Aspergillus venezuelensis]